MRKNKNTKSPKKLNFFLRLTLLRKPLPFLSISTKKKISKPPFPLHLLRSTTQDTFVFLSTDGDPGTCWPTITFRPGTQKFFSDPHERRPTPTWTPNIDDPRWTTVNDPRRMMVGVPRQLDVLPIVVPITFRLPSFKFVLHFSLIYHLHLLKASFDSLMAIVKDGPNRDRLLKLNLAHSNRTFPNRNLSYSLSLHLFNLSINQKLMSITLLWCLMFMLLLAHLSCCGGFAFYNCCECYF